MFRRVASLAIRTGTKFLQFCLAFALHRIALPFLPCLLRLAKQAVAFCCRAVVALALALALPSARARARARATTARQQKATACFARRSKQGKKGKAKKAKQNLVYGKRKEYSVFMSVNKFKLTLFRCPKKSTFSRHFLNPIGFADNFSQELLLSWNSCFSAGSE